MTKHIVQWIAIEVNEADLICKLCNETLSKSVFAPSYEIFEYGEGDWCVKKHQVFHNSGKNLNVLEADEYSPMFRMDKPRE